MFDSVTVSNIPSDAIYAAGYVNGGYANIPGIQVQCPHAVILSIDIAGDSDADCLDVEPGAASASVIPEWVRRQRARGVVRPVIYASASNILSCLASLENGGLTRNDIRLWSAHYIGEHICNPNCGYGNWQADGTQWTETALGRNLDQSLLFDEFFVKPPVPDPNHYNWFEDKAWEFGDKKINERATVEAYDQLREHPDLHEKHLRELRDDLSMLAGRVYSVAHAQYEQNGKPSWGQFHRGWRFQELIHRSEGKRFA